MKSIMVKNGGGAAGTVYEKEKSKEGSDEGREKGRKAWI